MRYFYVISLIAFSFYSQAQNFTLSGKVTDKNGEPLPYTNVVVTGTSKGTSTNFDGIYQLELSPGVYNITYQFIGYRSKMLSANLTDNNQELNVVLEEEVLKLREVVVDGEDLAYGIIRNAQRKRKTYLNEFPKFKNKAYTKIFAQSESAGYGINLFGANLTTDVGIFYLSESFSEIIASNSRDRSETLTASIISGDTSKYSANRAVFLDFYRNRSLRTNSVQFVSPIASDAFTYYDYEFEGYFTENGQIINKIKLLPKQKTFPAFTGHIYIIEDSWRIYGLHVFAEQAATSVGKIEVKVSHTYLEQEKLWLPFSVDLFFENSNLEAFYHSIHYNYEFESSEIEETPTALRYKIAEGTKDKSDEFWENNRPIPLTDEEKKTYKEDKEKLLKKSNEDSVRLEKFESDSVVVADSLKSSKKRSFSFSKELFEYNTLRLNQYWTLRRDPLLFSINFNTVEGVVLEQNFKFTKTLSDERKIELTPTFRYGFSSNDFYGKLYAAYDLNLKKPERISVTGGHYVDQISGTTSITPILNTLYSLAVGENFLKLYEKSFGQVDYKKELINGLDLSLGAGYFNRNSLQNNSDFSFRSTENTDFTSNTVVINGQPQDFSRNNIFKYSALLTIAFNRPYNELPNRKEILPTRYPEIKLAYEGGTGDSDFNLFWSNISDAWEVGTWGRSSISASYGISIADSDLIAPDFFHFSGNQILVLQKDRNYNINFQLLDYYELSTDNEFFGANFKHSFKGKVWNQIPLLKKIKANTFFAGNYLFTNEAGSYFEVGGGLENLFNFFSVGYYQSYLGGNRGDGEVRFSVDVSFN